MSFSAEKLRLQEELFRLRSYRKDGEARKEHLLNRAKLLQARASSHKEKVKYFSLFSYLLSMRDFYPEIFLKQYDPPREFEFEITKWKATIRVMTKAFFLHIM